MCSKIRCDGESEKFGKIFGSKRYLGQECGVFCLPGRLLSLLLPCLSRHRCTEPGNEAAHVQTLLEAFMTLPMRLSLIPRNHKPATASPSP
jgi:hypothetical protein